MLLEGKNQRRFDGRGFSDNVHEGSSHAAAGDEDTARINVGVAGRCFSNPWDERKNSGCADSQFAETDGGETDEDALDRDSRRVEQQIEFVDKLREIGKIDGIRDVAVVAHTVFNKKFVINQPVAAMQAVLACMFCNSDEFLAGKTAVAAFFSQDAAFAINDIR